ncbi:U5 snRNP-specific protein [Toxoplasma gondii GAB2-2007-GAL-DOM2]|uniref:U5 snRNP-specific protein n=5 Tax=Toxoplasma gondii TaxID=5811 RepID=S7W8Z8_TOXGG|nr:U5 snRNP-specific protein [Toxoplasma gondii GT1]KAF4639266.1 U5 snRNP-specific protein [Toxoplasma gondii]KFG44475.1 U5 snRNP-specific protein [Toxoplasma gondii GAB2-2007-GAL-DOM2]KFG55865.1 U5 snRNP-specific protein [Toxoplasma gondii FOU]PUA91863.1 U5 snRNP-specific protein [Toxoplasma gondii TgCATBr9]
MALVAANAAGAALSVAPADAPSALAQNARDVFQSDRKSGLEAPTMRLSGHEGEVLAVNFSPDGRNIASAGVDRDILIYNVYGEISTWQTLKGHSKAILDFRWSSDGSQIYSASADQTAGVWDVETGERVKKLKGHVGIVNACSVASKEAAECPSRATYGCSSLFVTGADDGTTRVWDLRIRRSVKKYEHQYQILSVALDGHGGRVFAGCLDNTIRVYDLRGGDAESDVYEGHTDSVTGLSISASGATLLSNAMDHTVRVWDIQPFVHGGKRLVAALRGATHNFEKNLLRVCWSADEQFCSAGSADRYVCVWSMEEVLREKGVGAGTSPLLYRLPGHSGSVNDVCFHPTEPVIASASSDRTVFMGELS